MADHEAGVHAQVWEAQLRPRRGSRGQCPLHSEAGCLGGGCREGPSFWLRPPLSQPGPRRRSPWESAAPGSADPRFMAQPQGRRRTPSQGNKSELILACWLLLLSTSDLQATAHLGAGERAGGAGARLPSAHLWAPGSPQLLWRLCSLARTREEGPAVTPTRFRPCHGHALWFRAATCLLWAQCAVAEAGDEGRNQTESSGKSPHGVPEA